MSDDEITGDGVVDPTTDADVVHPTTDADVVGEASEAVEDEVAGSVDSVESVVDIGEPAGKVESERSDDVLEGGPDQPDPSGADRAPAESVPAKKRRMTTASLVIAILIGLLGFALVTQVKSNSNESTLANDRPDDLVRILSDLDTRKDRLTTEIAQLQETVRRLNSGAQGRQTALDEAAKRADELGILAGTRPAQGSGLEITFQPRRGKIAANDVLNAVEELRGAGAEAMSISSTTGAVRVVASTYFTDAATGVNVGGDVLAGALTIAVIGDPQTMQTALNIPGGVVETVRSDGGNVTITQPSIVLVTTLHHEDTLHYAQPAP
jgi:uncharacterized protein YlxW (UPF0749 family)